LTGAHLSLEFSPQIRFLTVISELWLRFLLITQIFEKMQVTQLTVFSTRLSSSVSEEIKETSISHDITFPENFLSENFSSFFFFCSPVVIVE
jgi:hypothetical protein